MRILSAPKGILAVELPNRRELTLTMCRMGEFYESPYPEIMGNSFTWEQFLGRYAREDGGLDYFAKWDGFNVPGGILDLFKRTFILSDREAELLDKFYEGRFEYLIAVEVGSDPTTLQHELCHAIFEMDNRYAHSVVDTISDSGLFEKLSRHLIAAEYPDKATVLLSEANAYLATSNEGELEETVPGAKIATSDLRRSLIDLWSQASEEHCIDIALPTTV